ncbi:MAG: aminotransferase class V-fold PLP-dependent enzyme [Lentisphaerae bacterium]|nr:aminotransferase class V-fold PLP-dependent enzyme [Lentisphaerota bacterium]
MNIVYLDHAATSRTKPECVYRAMDRFMREIGASPGRSAHAPGLAAGRVVADTRRAAAALFGVADPARVVFTLNCTQALNLALRGLARPGSDVVTTSVEHNSVMRPLTALARERGLNLVFAAADEEGMTRPGELAKRLTGRTSLIVMTHASNVTGAIQPIDEWGHLARERGVPFLVDAAQTAGCLPIDLSRLPVDLLAFSGHKGLLGPQGTGGLFIREGFDPEPLMHGGTGSASSEIAQPAWLPDRYESGTPNTPGLAGLGAAIGFLLERGVASVRERVCAVGEALAAGLAGLPRVRLYGPRGMDANVGIFAFTVDGADPAEVASALETRHGIMTRVGLQCAPCAHRAMGTFPSGTIRAGIGYGTTMADAETLVNALRVL